MTQYYTLFKTPAGWSGVLFSEVGLLRFELPQGSAEEAQRRLCSGVNHPVRSSQPFNDLIGRFNAYFSGQRVDFPDRLDLSSATDFQRQVWQATSSIPYGETRSYGWIAARIGRPKAVRAVGQALGRNPLPVIIPCHRVLAGNGALGGFSGGLDMKRSLLRLESLADSH